MKFSDVPYRRPELHTLTGVLRESAAGLSRAADFDEADALMLSADAAVRRFDSAYAAAFVRSSADTEDDLLRVDMRLFDAAAPKAERAEKKWLRAAAKSEFRAEFEAKYGRGFFAGEPEFPLPLRKREAALADEYASLLCAARIGLGGRELTLTEAYARMRDPAPERRYAAWDAVGSFFGSQSEKLDGIFDRLVRVRTRMAGENAYSRLRCRTLGRDPDEDDRFHEAVVNIAVPLADRVFRGLAGRTGCRYPLSPADAELINALPAPVCTARELPGLAAEVMREMSPQTAELADAVFCGGFADTEHRPGKAGDTFCTALPDSGMPFVFADLTGSGYDAAALFHELGHALALYSARGILPAQLRIPSAAVSETYAVCMEFFVRPYAELIFGSDAEEYRLSHLAQTVCAVPFEAMADRFQREVYEDPAMTPNTRCQKWLDLSRQYMPWLDMSASPPFFASGRGWQRIAHLYGEPFYYLEYALARCTAMQLLETERAGADGAWAAYLSALSAGGTQSSMRLLETAGLSSPYDEAAVRGAFGAAERLLEKSGRLG